MFCPKCGSEKVVDVFCARCLKEERPLVKAFKEFKAEACARSGAVKWHGRWHDEEDTTARLEELFAQQVVPAPYAEITDVRVVIDEVPLKEGLKTKGEARVLVTGRASAKAKPYVEEYDVPYEVLVTVSPKYAKLGTQYFEGTLQVRNETDDSRKFLQEQLARHGIGVAKTNKQRNGMDYYLTSKTAVERVALALQARFGGLVKTSAQLFSRNKQTSKEIYRVNALIELPPFGKGDVVRAGKQLLFIVEPGKRIKFWDPRKGKYQFHEYKDVRWEKLPVFETTVATTHPVLAVIHPETFQSIRVWNAAPQEREPGEKVRVTIDGAKPFIVEWGKG